MQDLVCNKEDFNARVQVLMGGQSRSFKTGVIWSNQEVLQISRASAYQYGFYHRQSKEWTGNAS